LSDFSKDINVTLPKESIQKVKATRNKLEEKKEEKQRLRLRTHSFVDTTKCLASPDKKEKSSESPFPASFKNSAITG
jgi:hypothetical protein